MPDIYTQSLYDLPYRYDDSRIVLLARDPYHLFAYWEISDSKKNTFLNEFGGDLWEKSIPVLKITNVSRNTSFYIRIEESVSSWYINVPEQDSIYIAEIGRRLSEQFFINLVSSNYIQTPNNSISSNTTAHFINYRDLAAGRIDPDTGNITDYRSFLTEWSAISGISSAELIQTGKIHEYISGVSSAELFGINLAEHLGISSESFIK